jgi:hypothetical protein
MKRLVAVISSLLVQDALLISLGIHKEMFGMLVSPQAPPNPHSNWCLWFYLIHLEWNM